MAYVPARGDVISIQAQAKYRKLDSFGTALSIFIFSFAVQSVT
jgi:hypothetical protein